MNAVIYERTLLSMVAERTQHGYRLTTLVPSIVDGGTREYVAEYSTLVALRERMDALQALWLDAEHIGLQDSLESC